MSFKIGREIKKARDRDEQLGPEEVFSPMPPSEGLKMLVSTMMTGHDGMCRERTSMVKKDVIFTIGTSRRFFVGFGVCSDDWKKKKHEKEKEDEKKEKWKNKRKGNKT